MSDTRIVIFEQIPGILETYDVRIKSITHYDRSKTTGGYKRRLSALKEEEARLSRLFVTEQIGEEAYAQLRTEWYEKKFNTQFKIEELEFDLTQYHDDLEVAIFLINRQQIMLSGFFVLCGKSQNTA